MSNLSTQSAIKCLLCQDYKRAVTMSEIVTIQVQFQVQSPIPKSKSRVLLNSKIYLILSVTLSMLSPLNAIDGGYWECHGGIFYINVVTIVVLYHVDCDYKTMLSWSRHLNFTTFHHNIIWDFYDYLSWNNTFYGINQNYMLRSINSKW